MPGRTELPTILLEIQTERATQLPGNAGNVRLHVPGEVTAVQVDAPGTTRRRARPAQAAQLPGAAQIPVEVHAQMADVHGGAARVQAQGAHGLDVQAGASARPHGVDLHQPAQVPGGQHRGQRREGHAPGHVHALTVDDAAQGVLTGVQREIDPLVDIEDATHVRARNRDGGQVGRLQLRVGPYGKARRRAAHPRRLARRGGAEVIPAAHHAQVPEGVQFVVHAQVAAEPRSARHGQVADLQAKLVTLPGQHLPVRPVGAALLDVIQLQRPAELLRDARHRGLHVPGHVAARGVQLPAAAQGHARAREVPRLPGTPEMPVEVELHRAEVCRDARFREVSRAAQREGASRAVAHHRREVLRRAGQGDVCFCGSEGGAQVGVKLLVFQVERSGQRPAQARAAQGHQVLLVDGGGNVQRLSGEIALPRGVPFALERPLTFQALFPGKAGVGAEAQIVGLRGVPTVAVQEGVLGFRVAERHARQGSGPLRVGFHAHGAPAARRDAQFQPPLPGGVQGVGQARHAGRSVGGHRPVLRFQVDATLRGHRAVPACAAQVDGDVVAPVNGRSGDVLHRDELRFRHAQQPTEHLHVTPDRAVPEHVLPAQPAALDALPVLAGNAGVRVEIHGETVSPFAAVGHLHLGAQRPFRRAPVHQDFSAGVAGHAGGDAGDVRALTIHVQARVLHVHPVDDDLPAVPPSSRGLAGAGHQFLELQVDGGVVDADVDSRGSGQGVGGDHRDVRPPRRGRQPRQFDVRVRNGG